MWQEDVFGSDTPDILRDILLYLLRLNFALRGGEEYYNLKIGENSQLIIAKDGKSGRRYQRYIRRKEISAVL